jgi:hypothetical protein
VPAEFLTHLRDAASSPLAFVAYGLVVAAWVLQTWLSQNPRRSAENILKQFKNDAERGEALQEVFHDQPPHGLPEKDVLEWVRVRSRDKGRMLLVVAWLATVFAVLLFLVAVYSKATSTPDRQVNIRLHRVGTNAECPDLPDTTRLLVILDADGTSLGELRVGADCKAVLPVPAAAKGTASFQFKNAGEFSISDARAHDLNAGDIDLSVSANVQARVRLSIFQYSSIECPDARQAFDTFETILRSKALSLRGMFDSSDHRYDYLSQVEVVPAGRPMNLDAQGIRNYLRQTGSLQVLYGTCTQRAGSMHMLSQVLLGELAGVLPDPFRADLLIAPEEFGAIRDIHTASILYALAQDAKQRNADRDMTISYLSRAKELVASITPEAATQLLAAIDNTLQVIGAPPRIGL